MKTLLLTFAVSLVLLTACGLFVGYSKRRRDRSSEGDTDMRRRTTGEQGGCCSAIVLPGKTSCCGGHGPRSCSRR